MLIFPLKRFIHDRTAQQHQIFKYSDNIPQMSFRVGPEYSTMCLCGIPFSIFGLGYLICFFAVLATYKLSIKANCKVAVITTQKVHTNNDKATHTLIYLSHPAATSKLLWVFAVEHYKALEKSGKNGIQDSPVDYWTNCHIMIEYQCIYIIWDHNINTLPSSNGHERLFFWNIQTHRRDILHFKTTLWFWGPHSAHQAIRKSHCDDSLIHLPESLWAILLSRRKSKERNTVSGSLHTLSVNWILLNRFPADENEK